MKEETAEGKVSPLLLACELDAEERAYLREKIEGMKANWQEERGEQNKALGDDLADLSNRWQYEHDGLPAGICGGG